MKEKQVKYSIIRKERKKSEGQYENMYLYFDDYSFEVVPHCRTIKEKALFYSLLKRSDMVKE